MQTLQRFVEDEEEKRGYQLTKTPYMAKSELYKISGIGITTRTVCL
jgi:threonyl-tRNA synthetase